MYVWAEDSYHSKNNGPFSTHNPANIIVYDPDLVADPSTNLLNMRAGVRLQGLDVSVFVDNLLNSHPAVVARAHQPGGSAFPGSDLQAAHLRSDGGRALLVNSGDLH